MLAILETVSALSVVIVSDKFISFLGQLDIINAQPIISTTALSNNAKISSPEKSNKSSKNCSMLHLSSFTQGAW